MKLNRILLTMFAALAIMEADAQNKLTSNNKTLAIFNPAMQNYQYNKFSMTNSVYISPFIASNNYISFTSAAEVNFKDRLRFGAYVSKSETRLNRFDNYKFYASYGFKFENEAVLALGFEVGYIQDQTKIAEFNKVWKPNHFTYTDSITSGLDIGLGASFRSNGWTVGLGLSKINKPNFVPYPDPVFESDSNDFTKVIISDTNIVYGSDYVLAYTLQSNINILYEWYASESIELMHAVHIGNIGYSGAEFYGFQTIMKYNQMYSFGLGVMYNEAPVYMVNAGITLFEKITLEASSFFMQDLEFETDGDNLLEDVDDYVNQGVKPVFEFNLRIDL